MKATIKTGSYRREVYIHVKASSVQEYLEAKKALKLLFGEPKSITLWDGLFTNLEQVEWNKREERLGNEVKDYCRNWETVDAHKERGRLHITSTAGDHFRVVPDTFIEDRRRGSTEKVSPNKYAPKGDFEVVFEYEEE